MYRNKQVLKIIYYFAAVEEAEIVTYRPFQETSLPDFRCDNPTLSVQNREV